MASVCVCVCSEALRENGILFVTNCLLLDTGTPHKLRIILCFHYELRIAHNGSRVSNRKLMQSPSVESKTIRYKKYTLLLCFGVIKSLKIISEYFL